MALYTQDHIEQQKKVHEQCPAYGQASLTFAPMVAELINANDIKSLLDYGSGLGEVPHNLDVQHKVDVRLYDPAIEQYSETPPPAEMVICLDVLDAVEADCIDDVLDDLKAKTERMAFFAINTTSSADNDDKLEGQYFPLEWWLPKLMERFELHYLSRVPTGFVVVLKALPAETAA